MPGRATRSLLLAGATLAAFSMTAGCVMPFGGEPSSPELDALRRDLRGSPMDRIRAHETCAETSPTAIVTCMQEAGYHVVGPSEDPRAGDCQDLLDSGDQPPAYCFASNNTP